jgi:hypothetical protein
MMLGRRFEHVLDRLVGRDAAPIGTPRASELALEEVVRFASDVDKPSILPALLDCLCAGPIGAALADLDEAAWHAAIVPATGVTLPRSPSIPCTTCVVIEASGARIAAVGARETDVAIGSAVIPASRRVLLPSAFADGSAASVPWLDLPVGSMTGGSPECSSGRIGQAAVAAGR